ncbi:hypothetical protein NEIMUCOT_03922 [Neisseria mucosa ATCC 25996]|uniref:Uncharacterized protein n=1 Tax=Neisseria mucosa (strain ATCC 25996 / DSM 4631 / NCTC 10774 / M26) TaxID=546266 RepID=D2ZTI6_NEIM2|nr:hypothetical protein NEIMUCOT_03922 [Neisseria mucosa ATCC 25996]
MDLIFYFYNQLDILIEFFLYGFISKARNNRASVKNGFSDDLG